MGSDTESSTAVALTPPSRRSRVLWLVFADSDAAHRAGQVAAALTAAQEGKLSLDGLFEARARRPPRRRRLGAGRAGTSGRRVGAQLVDGEPESTALQLHAALDEYCLRHDACFAQASLPATPTPVEARLRASGYRHAAEIRYLACLHATTSRRDAPLEAEELEFEPSSNRNLARLTAVVETHLRADARLPRLERRPRDGRRAGGISPLRQLRAPSDG